MKNVLRKLIGSLLILIIAINIQAQSFTVTGAVVSDENEKLIGANVILENTKYGTITDVDGNYEIKNVVAGNYQLSISYIGAHTQTVDIEVNKDINWMLLH